MDGFNEKKWFVYLTDHHEGPFSLSEIQAKMSQSQVSTANYVWAEGLTDWKPMTEVAEFESILSTSHQVAAAASGVTNSPTSTVMLSPGHAAPDLAVHATGPAASESFAQVEIPSLEIPGDAAGPAVQEEKTGDLDASDLKQAKLLSMPAAEAAPTQIYAEPGPSANAYKAPAPAAARGKSDAGRLIKWAVIILVPAGIAGAYFNGALDPVLASPAVKAGLTTAHDFTQPYLLKLAEKVPALASLVSPIPSLEDVTPEDYEALKQAAMQKLPDVRIAVAGSTGDVFAPVFYVSSNLPDGAVVDLYIEGIPDTLLNQLAFHGKAQATIQKKLGRTAPVHFNDGKAMPRGEYVIYATESPQQPDAIKSLLASVPPVTSKIPPMLPKELRLLVSKPVFLGGNKDATYSSRLKEFHDKLRAKAAGEIAEVKQLEMTLEGQLTQTTAKYNQLRGQVRNGKPSPAARKGWADFNAQWSKLEDQLKQSYAKWTDTVLETEYFYGVLYATTKSAGDSVDKLHQLHSEFFEGKTDVKTFEIQRGGAISVAESAVAALKNKITQAESLAPTANGMPRREGL